MSSADAEPEVDYERMLEECLSPYDLGREAAAVALEHIAKAGFVSGDGETFRDNMGNWVAEYLADATPHQLDLGVAVITVVAGRVTVRLYENAKNKTGPSRLCLPASRPR